MRLEHEEFVRRYGGIYEHSAWVAEQGFATARDLPDTNALAGVFAAVVDATSGEQKLALIRAHPDLAGRAAIAGELTGASTEEQAGAGIDQCSAEEFQRFQSLNDSYREKFGFPFVMAVRNSNRQEILAGFTARLDNDVETEFARAISEIHKIARLRLQAMETHDT
jgi:2-oxo-4-hydroxy-4-carboxy-5-ureidoimidazoline decarboxylase